MEGGGALLRDALADDEGLARGGAAVGLLPGQEAAGVGLPVKVTGVLLTLGLLTEAAVGMSFLHQKLGILAVEGAPLGLHIGANGAAHIRTLVVLQVALGHGLVDHVHRAFHEASLVGVLDAQQELAIAVPGDQVGVERRAQVAHMHIPRGRGGKTGAHLVFGDAGLHFVKPCHVHIQYLLPSSLPCLRGAVIRRQPA